MSTEQNKKVASDFFALLGAGDLTGALELVTDDFNWWIAGKPDQLPAAGDYNKEKISRLLSNMGRQFKNGLKMTVKSSIAEGDKVALEAESYGELKNGRVYNQQYHFLMTIRDGKISSIKEYLDTQHVFAIWFQE